MTSFKYLVVWSLYPTHILLEQNHRQRNWSATMKEKDSPSEVVFETSSPKTTLPSTEEDIQRHWQGVVKRRSFLKGLGIAGAALSAGTLLATEGTAQTSSSTAFVLPFDEAEPRGRE